MIQVVIVDDEISNIENLTIMLNKYCPKIVVAGTALNIDQALMVIRETTPSILFFTVNRLKFQIDILAG